MSGYECQMYLHHETDAAYLLSETPDSDMIWFPKSKVIIIERKGGHVHERVDVDIPEWLAKEKGLI